MLHSNFYVYHLFSIRKNTHSRITIINKYFHSFAHFPKIFIIFSNKAKLTTDTSVCCTWNNQMLSFWVHAVCVCVYVYVLVHINKLLCSNLSFWIISLNNNNNKSMINVSSMMQKYFILYVSRGYRHKRV